MSFFTAMTTKRPPVPSALWIPRKEIYVKPGEKATISCGTSFENVSLLCQLFDEGMTKKCYRLNADNENIEIEIPYEKNYGPSLTLALCFVKENRLYASEIVIRRKKPRHEIDDYTPNIPRLSRQRNIGTLEIQNKRQSGKSRTGTPHRNNV